MNLSSSSLLFDLASFRSQTISSLMNSGIGSAKGDAQNASSAFDLLLGGFPGQRIAPDFSGTSGAARVAEGALTGRNMSLFDPESAFRMMSVINRKDVTYKAEFAELSEMTEGVLRIQDAARALGGISGSTSNEAIKTQLQDFAGQYNFWIDQFSPDVRSGGLLAGTQSAQVALHELDCSVGNIFNGAKDGVGGLSDLGLNVDPKTQKIVVDTARLDSLLSSNKLGAVCAVSEFSQNFTEAANCLTADGKFLRRQLSNLDNAIDYIRDNVVALKQEFGTGDAFKPTGQVAKALAAYDRMALG